MIDPKRKPAIPTAVRTRWFLMRDEADLGIAATPRLALEDDASVVVLDAAVVGLAAADFAFPLKLLPQS